MPTRTIAARRQAFHALHAQGCFVMPNPWDAGSAVYLQSLGFPAVATTSAGFAFSQGLADSESAVPRDRSLAHIADMVAAVDLPLNADFASGYGAGPDEVAESVTRCVETGVAGLSVEDFTGRPAQPLYDVSAAVDRIKAARAAIDAAARAAGGGPDGGRVLLTARAECYLVGHPSPFEEARRRLVAYAEAGADVLYAPGALAPDEIAGLVRAVAPFPVNVVVGRNVDFGVADLAALGVRRISIGGALARAAWTAFTLAAGALKDGRFTGFADLVPSSQLNALFGGRS